MKYPAMIPQQIVYAVLALFVTALLIMGFFAAPKAKAQEIVLPAYVKPLCITSEIISIADAENWDGKSIGAKGERGRLQFTARRWYQLSVKPHWWASSNYPECVAETKRVEVAHIEDLIMQARVLKKKPTPYVIALLHTAGYGDVASGHCSAEKKDFAQRAANIYEEGTKSAAWLNYSESQCLCGF